MEKGATAVEQPSKSQPEDTVAGEEGDGEDGDDDDFNFDISDEEIKKRLEELNLKWEDIFPEEVLNWDTELPEDKKQLEYVFKHITSDPIEIPKDLANEVRRVASEFMREHIPAEHHFRAEAAVEYLLKVCPLTEENREKFESMAIFEVWFSYFDEYLLATNTAEECKRWIELMRDIDWNELLWDQERRDTPMENCFNIVWRRFQAAAIEDQRHIMAKSIEGMVEEIQKEVEDPEEVYCMQEDKFIERRWKRLNFDIQWVVIDILLGLKWEQEMFDSGRHKPLRRRGERFLIFLHDLYFFEQDYVRKRPKMDIMGMLRIYRDFISSPMTMKGVCEIVHDRLDYYEWELDQQINEYFSQPEYIAYNGCVRRFLTESVNYFSATNKVEQVTWPIPDPPKPKYMPKKGKGKKKDEDKDEDKDDEDEDDDDDEDEDENEEKEKDDKKE